MASRVHSTGTGISESVPVGRAAAGEVTHIPAYKPSTGSNLAFFDAVNRVKSNQNFFQSAGPVFLRSPRDVLLYRGIMAVSVVGLGITFFSIYQMATGKMTKKGSS